MCVCVCVCIYIYIYKRQGYEYWAECWPPTPSKSSMGRSVPLPPLCASLASNQTAVPFYKMRLQYFKKV